MWPQRKRSETGRAPGLLSARDLLMHKARAESILHTSRSLGAQQHHARSLRGSLIRFQAQTAQFTQQAKPHTPRGYPSRLGREEKTIKMRDETDAGCCWGLSGTGWGEEVRELLFVPTCLLRYAVTNRKGPGHPALNAAAQCSPVSFVTASFYTSCFSLRAI